MALLDSVLEKKIRLIDYECVRDIGSGERLIAFGEYAGRAGMIDTLRGMLFYLACLRWKKNIYIYIICIFVNQL